MHGDPCISHNKHSERSTGGEPADTEQNQRADILSESDTHRNECWLMLVGETTEISKRQFRKW